MKSSWTKGMSTAQEKEDIRGAFKQSLYFRKRMLELLQDKIEERERASMSDEGYDCPNWAYKQAANQGYKKALLEVISLISDKS